MTSTTQLPGRINTTTLIRGGLIGVIAGMMMAMFTMIATGTYLHLGFFAPLYAIGAPITGNAPMTAYVMHGILSVPDMLVGLMVHMADSFMLGAIFAAVVSYFKWTRSKILVVAVIYGLLVEATFKLAILPLVGSQMASQLGILSFTLAHIIFGMTLGLVMLILWDKWFAPTLDK